MRMSKTTVALATLFALIAIPYASPKMASFRIPLPFMGDANASEVSQTTIAAAPLPSPTVGSLKVHETANEATVTNALAPTRKPLDPDVLAKAKGTVAIEDAAHHLDTFFANLHKTARKETGAVTRILHYGDSVITSDYVSGTARRLLQEKYGDAGHGFVLVANGWDWYFHNAVTHFASGGWDLSRITGPFTKDGAYGVGGCTFRGWNGVSASFGTAERGEFGRKVSRFDVYYLEQPKGGDLELKSGSKVERLSTAGDSKVSRVYSFAVPDGDARLALRVMGAGEARLFGVALERDNPGVVYDALGGNGARVRLLDQIETGHWKEQMALRKPSLVVLSYGTNESEDGMIDVAVYEKGLAAVIDKARAAAPMASILVMAPLDRAEKNMHSAKSLVRLVTAQRKVAAEAGVAFWNTWQAMGGEGSMGKWVQSSPQLGAGDLTHPTPSGAQLIGELFVKAIDASFAVYEDKHKP